MLTGTFTRHLRGWEPGRESRTKDQRIAHNVPMITSWPSQFRHVGLCLGFAAAAACGGGQTSSERPAREASAPPAPAPATPPPPYYVYVTNETGGDLSVI